MVSVEEAHLIIRNTVKSGASERRHLHICLGKVLAEDIFAPFDLPSFDQAAMDGYAFDFATFDGSPLEVVCDIAAGDHYEGVLTSGTAARIFTGARLPQGSDTVVVKEKCAFDQKVSIQDPALKQGANVRLKGSVFRKGDMVFTKGTKLTPASLGTLASMGFEKITVFQPPCLAILTTGSELSPLGTPYHEGIVYNSNAIALGAAAEQIGLPPLFVGHCEDEPSKLKHKMDTLLEKVDFLLITGGMSVGDYDYSARVLEELGVQALFHKVKQKPGKPFYFGFQPETQKYVFGLPGNPAAALTCFLEYVIPATDYYQGNTDAMAPKLQLALAHNYQKKEGLAHFLKAKTNGHQVALLEGQESHRLESLALADCLVYVPATSEEVKKGDLVSVKKL